MDLEIRRIGTLIWAVAVEVVPDPLPRLDEGHRHAAVRGKEQERCVRHLDGRQFGVSGGGDRDVVPLVRVDPEYPPRARQQGIEGWVEVEFTISPVGTVQDAVVIASKPSFVFDRAALRAIRKWRYNPKVENGVAIARPGIQVRLRFEIPRGR